MKSPTPQNFGYTACTALDRLTGRTVSVCKVQDFDTEFEAQRLLGQLRMLRHLSAHEGVLKLYDLVCPKSDCGEFKDLYIVCEKMDSDLASILNSKCVLTNEHCQYILYQLLRGLKFIHSVNVIHGDLQPEYLLLNANNCLLKIGDFTTIQSAFETELTDGPILRRYWSPERIMSVPGFNTDVWTAGCMFAEMLRRQPLFNNSHWIDQMKQITSVLGSLNAEDLNSLPNAQARKTVGSLPARAKVPFATLCPTANPMALDLLEKMLVFNPQKRISVTDALQHPYFATIRDIRSETECHIPVMCDVDRNLNLNQLHELIWEEILLYRPEALPLRDYWRTRQRSAGTTNGTIASHAKRN